MTETNHDHVTSRFQLGKVFQGLGDRVASAGTSTRFHLRAENLANAALLQNFSYRIDWSGDAPLQADERPDSLFLSQTSQLAHLRDVRCKRPFYKDRLAGNDAGLDGLVMFVDAGATHYEVDVSILSEVVRAAVCASFWGELERLNGQACGLHA